MNGDEAHDTYTVYDNYGNVRFVLPPLAADSLTAVQLYAESHPVLQRYAYIYHYDKYNRCIYKKLPGCDPVYTIYDAADRPIFTQDGEQRKRNEWSFSIPDGFGRVVLSGICKNQPAYGAESTPLDTVVVKAVWANEENPLKGYRLEGITLSSPTVLSVNYYDSYDFLGKNGIPDDATTAYCETAGYGKRYGDDCKGQQTGILTARFTDRKYTGFIYSALYYDDRYRVVQRKGNNGQNGTESVYTAYNFEGSPTKEKHVHSVPGQAPVVWANEENPLKGYRLEGITLSSPTVLSVNYYDSYDFLGKNGIPDDATTAYCETAGYGKRYGDDCKGQQTGILTARFTDRKYTGFIYSALYYDDRYRVVQRKGNNGQNGTESVYTAYNFEGSPTKEKHVHSVPGQAPVTEVHTYTYDLANRLLKSVYQLNDKDSITLVDNIYDEVGRLFVDRRDRRNGVPELRTNYSYNLRSWLKGVSSPLFSQTLNYQETINDISPCYNGNISSLFWRTAQNNASNALISSPEKGYSFTYDGLSRLKDAVYGEGASLNQNRNRFNEQITGYDKMGNILGLLRSSLFWRTAQNNASNALISSPEKGYSFTYDGLSRLKDAVYGEGASLNQNRNRFNEQITGYDKMGNILGLLRYGQTGTDSYGLIDNLNLTYNGNQLQSVYDNATSVYDNATNSVFGNGMEFKDAAHETVEYAYDKNGNLTKDLNKNITEIQYNILNLPSHIRFADGSSIVYEYAADGSKVRTTHTINDNVTSTVYCGNAVYENGSLKMLLNESGYYSFQDNKFHFYIKDHQGNVRVVADETGKVDEVNDYYPFGGLMSNVCNNVQPYKYNGKELDRKGGLDWYDYGARMYDEWQFEDVAE